MVKRSWWAGVIGEQSYDLAVEEPTREDAIREALKLVEPGERFQIIEAALSSDMRYEGADFVPFAHARNHEILTAGPVNVES